MDIICVENLTKKYDHFKLDNFYYLFKKPL